MESSVSSIRAPKFRDGVAYALGDGEVTISRNGTRCSFRFSGEDALAVSTLMRNLQSGEMSVDDLASRSPAIAEQIPPLLTEFDHLRLLTESRRAPPAGVTSEAQLYREVVRLADRVIHRCATSAFHAALVAGSASRRQLIGYALEYYWLTQVATGLLGPALGTAKSPRERRILETFMKSEFGHDELLAASLRSVGLSDDEIEAHQPLPTTFSLCASLGVYARQDPLSFKACLFLVERAQPAFVDAFDRRCRDLGLPTGFHAPLRTHSDINLQYDHGDISKLLMAADTAVTREAAVIVKRNVSLMVETLIKQEEEILSYYGREQNPLPRTFAGIA